MCWNGSLFSFDGHEKQNYSNQMEFMAAATSTQVTYSYTMAMCRLLCKSSINRVISILITHNLDFTVVEGFRFRSFWVNRFTFLGISLLTFDNQMSADRVRVRLRHSSGWLHYNWNSTRRNSKLIADSEMSCARQRAISTKWTNMQLRQQARYKCTQMPTYMQSYVTFLE